MHVHACTPRRRSCTPALQVDPEGDLAPFWQTAASAERTGGALSERQAETLDQIARELMASPHIVRCVLMQGQEAVPSSGGGWAAGAGS